MQPLQSSQRHPGHGVHQADKADDEGPDQPFPLAAPGRQHRHGIAPDKPRLVPRKPGEGSGTAHASDVSRSTMARNMSSRLVSLPPRLSRNSLSVPSTIRRPPEITPMRSAMRSAISRMCVVMMTVLPFDTRSARTDLT